MKYQAKAVTLVIAFAVPALAQVSTPFSRLETEYRRTRAETLQQLNARYITSFEALKRAQMGQNDLAGANASQAFIDELKTDNAALSQPPPSQVTSPALTGRAQGSLLQLSIETFPTKVYLDNGRHKQKEVTFQLEQRLIKKARLVVKFTGRDGGAAGGTAGSIFIFRPGIPLKKVGNWTRRDAKKGDFECDILKHIAEPGEYKLRFATTEDGGDSLEPRIRID